MKKCHIFFGLLLWAGTFACLAQPDGDMPPGRHSGEMGESHRGARMAPPGFQPASPLHRIMQDLRNNNPEEFTRLQELRMSNPEAFRNESRQIMQQAFLEKMKAERPQVYDAIIHLPEPDQVWFFDRIMGPGFAGPGAPPPGWEKGRKNNEREIGRELIREFHQTDSPEEKDAIRIKLRDLLSAQYDQRLNDRKAQITEAEQKLDQIKQSLEQGMAEKDAFIDEKLSIWLSGKHPRFKGPKNDSNSSELSPSDH